MIINLLLLLIVNNFNQLIKYSKLFNKHSKISDNTMTQRSKTSQIHINILNSPPQPTQQSNLLINKLKMQSNHQNIHEGGINHKILIRKNKNKLIKEQPGGDKSMRKTMNYLSNRSPVVNSSSNNLQMTYRHKQKFIDVIQSKVINSNDHCNIMMGNQKKAISTRYNNHLGSNSYRININQNNSSKSKELNCLTAQPKPQITNRTHHYVTSFRTRSRTMTKEQQINRKIGETHNQISKTIEIDMAQQRQKMHKSLIEIQKYQKVSIGRQTKQVMPNYQFIHQELATPILIPKPEEAILQLNQTVHINNTVTYQKEVNLLTKDFFQEWEKMNFAKSKLYKSLRKKMVSVFPNMKKHYSQFKASLSMKKSDKNEDELNQRKSIQDLIAFTFKSDKDNLATSNQSISNNNPNQIKDYEEKIRQFQQKQLLRDIFKQACFWSRTKNKFMTNNFQQNQQADRQQMRNLKKIQTKLTFIHYMKSKNNKSQILNNRNKIKGSNIMRNKQIILEIEKQGSRQQQFLKKCLQNAIQNCIRENQ